MSRLKGMRGARKLRAFKKERIAVCSSEDDWETALSTSGDRLLVAEFSAVCRVVALCRFVQSLLRRVPQSWSVPCKAMAPYFSALAQQPEYRAVDFLRVDLEACPVRGCVRSQSLGEAFHGLFTLLLAESALAPFRHWAPGSASCQRRRTSCGGADSWSTACRAPCRRS
jgi:thiol-disulfide isomerase/thioredoxin